MVENPRLMRALAAATPPARDAAFVMAVLARAETARFRAVGLRSVLRGAGFAAAVAALAMLLAGWASAHPAAVMEGTLTVGALMTLVGAARMMVGRIGSR